MTFPSGLNSPSSKSPSSISPCSLLPIPYPFGTEKHSMYPLSSYSFVALAERLLDGERLKSNVNFLFTGDLAYVSALFLESSLLLLSEIDF